VTERNSKVGQSIDVIAPTDSRISTLFAPTPSAFSSIHERRCKFDRIRLPSLKQKNLDELLLSPTDIKVMNSNDAEPSPGAWPLAHSRACFAPLRPQALSFSKIGLRSHLHQSLIIQKPHNDSLYQDSTSALDSVQTSKLSIATTNRVGLSDAIVSTINTARHAHLNDRSYIQALCKPNPSLNSVRNAPKESLFGVNSSRDTIGTLRAKERDKPDSMFFKNILKERKQPSYDRYSQPMKEG